MFEHRVVSDPVNLLPLLDVPITAFGDLTDDMKCLLRLRIRADRSDGFFLVRQDSVKSVGATMPLYGTSDIAGRWHLGKIRWDPIIPDMYELFIRRTNSCYYGACFGKGELSANIEYLMLEADAAMEADTVGGAEGRPKDAFWDIVENEDPFAAYGFPLINAQAASI